MLRPLCHRAFTVRQSIRNKTSALRPLTTTSIEELDLCASDPDLVQVYRQHGCCAIRGLNTQWVDPITTSIERTVKQTRRL